MTSGFDDIVDARRSVRRFEDRDVPEPMIREILDLARRAPSSLDGQPWRFVVIRSADTRRHLAELKNLHCPPEKRSYPADFLSLAPVVVAVCVEQARSFGRELECGVLATAFLLLAAASRGLGGVYLSARQHDDPRLEASIHELLRCPADVRPVTLVPLGYPSAPPTPKRLRPLEDMISHEVYDADVRNGDRHFA